MAEKKRKGEYGDGTFRRTPSGGYEYRVRYENVYGERKRKSFSGKNYEDCLRRAQIFLEKNARQCACDLDFTLTIPQIAKMKAEKNFENNFTSQQSYRRNLETIKIIERTPLGSIPIVDVTDRMLETFLSSIKDYANTTMQKIFQVIRSAFAWAKENQLIEVNIITAHNIRCPRSNKRDKIVEALSVEDQKRLIEYLNNFKPYAYRNVYTLQLMIEMYAGLRMGEINALRVQDIDLKKNVINVRGTITMGLNYEIYRNETTKTDAGIRQVPIVKELMPYIEKALEQYRDNRYKLLFYDHEHDKMITTAQVNSFYLRACEKLGIPSSGQHCLRHTFATRCIESGVEAIVLKTWMGHTNIHVTLDTYADVFASMHNSAIAVLGDYMKTLF